MRDRCVELGIRFDAWQDGAGRIILSKRADGSYATSVGGVVISIPRQVGKTFLIGALVFALCLLFPGLTVIWTAHRLRTAGETFATMQGFARRRKIAPHIEKVWLGSGEEEIRFRNGSRILFGARERGFGRGFTLVDVLVFDEAQILTENAIDDMVPATNQAPNPLLLFTGTPPKSTDPSEVFTAKRDKALSGSGDDMAYVEFSADSTAELDDRKQWAKANPSYPKRTPAQAILRMRENLSDESFKREALGIWELQRRDHHGLDIDAWLELAAPNVERGKRVVFGVDVGADRMAHIAVAWRRGARVHVQMTSESGVSPLHTVDRLAKLTSDWKGPVMVGGTSSSLADDVKRSKVVSASEFASSVGRLVDLLSERQLSHGNQSLLNDAVSAARLRPFGTAGEQTLVLQGTAEVGPLAAVVRAMHGLGTGPKQPPPKPKSATASSKGAHSETADLSSLQF